MKKRYEGTRWSLLYGSYEDVEKFAVEEAQRYFQSYLPYVMRVEGADRNGASAPEKLWAFDCCRHKAKQPDCCSIDKKRTN